ncbi:class I SAM-dependent methyltransferase [Thermodesulfobacteriota bacterium]
MKQESREQMLMNWPERVFIYSPVRLLVQKRHARRWLEMATPEHTGSALEIGCGHGRGARILVDKLGFRNVFAFDLEEILIQRAARWLPPKYARSIDFFVGDAQDLPFATGAFDAVVNYGIIHHVLDWRRCIAEISRVLRPGGIFYFEEIYPALYSSFILKRLLRHPREDRFDGPGFLEALVANGLVLVERGTKDSRFGIVAAARKA